VLAGDLDNRMPMRVLIIFEKTLGFLDNKHAKREALAQRLHRWDKAAEYWDLDEGMISRIWDLYTRYDLRTDVVVTSRPSEFSKALASKLEERDLPVRRVLTSTVGELAHMLPRMPDVYTVLYADPDMLAPFGAKGQFLASTTSPVVY
jgi:hypothetical protein